MLNLDFSIFSIPRLFLDSAKIPGVNLEFGLFYLSYPAAISRFCKERTLQFQAGFSWNYTTQREREIDR